MRAGLTGRACVAVIAGTILAWLGPHQGACGEEAQLGFEIVGVLPHDPGAFTQGLLYHRGAFFESTGGYGASSLRRVDPLSGRVLLEHRLAPELFGEGLTQWGERLIQLTWRERRGLLYDVETLQTLGEFEYPSEGWGITSTDTHLVMSDGSARLVFLDPLSYQPVGELVVRDAEGPVRGLNELEYVRGRVLANVFGSGRIVVIDSASGEVTASLNLERLVRWQAMQQDTPVGVLNGIAHDPERDLFFVTGKNWSSIYELHLEGEW